MSVVAHFFMSVGGSEIHERLSHFFIDFYTLTEVVNISIFYDTSNKLCYRVYDFSNGICPVF